MLQAAGPCLVLPFTPFLIPPVEQYASGYHTFLTPTPVASRTSQALHTLQPEFLLLHMSHAACSCPQAVLHPCPPLTSSV